MKKLILLLILTVILFDFVSSQDCEYRINETKIKEGHFFIDHGKELNYSALEIINFQQGTVSTPVSFEVHNNYSEVIEVDVRYDLSDSSSNTTLTINPQTFQTISYPAPNQIDRTSIKFKILFPPSLDYVKKITYKEEVCRQCHGVTCLNDGASCDPLAELTTCGTGVCNIAGTCGYKKVVDCLGGLRNCNDKICLASSTKEVGEGYACPWECKSDRYLDGECSKSTDQLKNESAAEEAIILAAKIAKQERIKNWIIFGVAILLVILLFYWKLKKKMADGEEERAKNATKEYEQVKKMKYNLNNEIEKTNETLMLLKEEKNDLREEIGREKIKSNEKINLIKEKENEEIRILQERKKNKKAEAQKIIDREIEKVRKDRQKEIDMAKEEGSETVKSLNSQIIKNNNLILEEKYKEHGLREKIKKQEDEEAEIERTSPERKIKILLHKYLDKYGTKSRNIEYSKELGRFIITSIYHPPELLSRHVYKKYVNEKILDKQVHHINYDALIDEPWNLIAISKDDHNKIKHININKGDWNSGLKELLRALNWIISDLPEHIRKEIEKGKNSVLTEY